MGIVALPRPSIATWGGLTPRQSFSALTTTPCQVCSRWTYPLPYYSVLLLMHYFTLWPWPLIFDLEQSPCNFRRLGTFDKRFSGVRGSNFTKLGKDIYGDHRCVANLFQSSDISLHFHTRTAQSWVMLKFHSFWPPPVKIRGVVGEISGSINEALYTTQPPEYIWWRLRGCWARCTDEKESSSVKLTTFRHTCREPNNLMHILLSTLVSIFRLSIQYVAERLQ